MGRGLFITMPYLSIKNLTYTYPASDHPALSGVDLEVERGEFIALVGPNAAGKSTLAMAIKGLVRRTGGTVSIGGRVWSEDGPDSRVGLLLSNPENQLVTSIVEEDVAFGLESLGLESVEIVKKVSGTLRELGIERLSRSLPHRLSGGEQQMVALAGVLAPDPEVIVLDEPTSFLDPVGRELVMKALENISRKGRTVVLVTHDMEEATRAHRVALIINGRIECVRKPLDFFADSAVLDAGRIVKPFIIDLLEGLAGAGVKLERSLYSTGELAGLLSERFTRDAGVGGLLKSGLPRFARGSADGDAVTFDSVSFAYDSGGPNEKKVLSGVDLSVQKGALALLCGANGSGKSTLLQLSNGLLTPDGGKVLCGGQDLAILMKRKVHIPSRVGLLFQNPERQVFSETVYDDIAFGPRNLGLKEDQVRKRVVEAALWTGIDEDLFERSPFTLSGGQLRRTAIAGVLALQSQVLVLDEPADGLDPASSVHFVRKVKEYALQTGTAVLMASHRVLDTPAELDTVAVLDGGTVALCGDPVHVLFSHSGVLPESFLPPHIRIQKELTDCGFSSAGHCLDRGEAVRNIITAVMENSP